MRLAALILALSVPALAATDEATAAWSLDTGKPVKVKRGAAGKAHLEIIPRADAHVSPDAPIGLTVTAPDGVTLEKAKLGRADSKPTAKNGVQFDVPFTAEKSGEIKGKLNFFICTEKLCERQTKELALAVVVE